MDPLTAILDLIKTAGVPGAIALVIILRIEKRLDALTAAVLSLPSRLSLCPSLPKSSQAACQTGTPPP